MRAALIATVIGVMLSLSGPLAPAAVVTTLAGTGSIGFNGDGRARSTNIAPAEIAFHPFTQELYFTDGSRIRRLTKEHTVETLATLKSVARLTFDPRSGGLYFIHNHVQVCRLSATGKTLEDVAGSVERYASTFAKNPLARKIKPRELAVSPKDGTLYISDASTRILALDGNRKRIRIIAGSGTFPSPYLAKEKKQGPAKEIDISATNLTIDSLNGDLLFVDGRTRIQRVNLQKRVIQTMAGTNSAEFTEPGDALFTNIFPIDLAATPREPALYFLNGSFRLYKLIYDHDKVISLAGTGTWGLTPDGFGGKLNLKPSLLVIEPKSGWPYFVDHHWRVRRLRIDDNWVETVAGVGPQDQLPEPVRDGSALETQLRPSAMKFGPDGRLYFIDRDAWIRVLSQD